MENQNPPRPLPTFFVGKQTTLNRISDYLLNKNPLLSKFIGKPETQNIWYSRDHIARLLAEIDHLGGDGLRLHLGCYEQDHPNFAGQLCLLMNVTREESNGSRTSHQNVYLEDEPDFEERSLQKRGSPTEDLDFEEQDKDYNQGSPCPPLCDL